MKYVYEQAFLNRLSTPLTIQSKAAIQNVTPSKENMPVEPLTSSSLHYIVVLEKILLTQIFIIIILSFIILIMVIFHVKQN